MGNAHFLAHIEYTQNQKVQFAYWYGVLTKLCSGAWEPFPLIVQKDQMYPPNSPNLVLKVQFIKFKAIAIQYLWFMIVFYYTH